jgi:hypothetical protein
MAEKKHTATVVKKALELHISTNPVSPRARPVHLSDSTIEELKKLSLESKRMLDSQQK